MSVASDSPVHSSSSDDFATFLEDELASDSSDSLQDKEYDDVEGQSNKRRKVEQLEMTEEAQEATLYESSKEYPELARDNLCVHPGFFEDKCIKCAKKVENVELARDDSCVHPGFFGDMCIKCGKKVDDAAGVSLGYIHKGLKLANDEISRLRNADVKNLLQHKKLYLVLDLDHTLLNSTRLQDISPDEEYLRTKVDSFQDVSQGSLFEIATMRMLTKLRPFVRTFLKEANNLFEMFIYTMGERAYALEMAKLLDPTKSYFDTRVISNADCTKRHQKGLDVVLGHENAVLILDDTEAVWEKHKDNLILMDRYHYFSSSCRQFGFIVKSLSEMKSDENESDGQLATVLEVLKRIHSLFYDPERKDDLASRDVRQVLKTVKKEVLKGCKVVFSRVFPSQFPANEHQLWKMAERLGAECTTAVDPSVTHVIALDTGTEKARWAVKEKKFLVHPRWIEAANYLWQRQPEDKFPVVKEKEKEKEKDKDKAKDHDPE